MSLNPTQPLSLLVNKTTVPVRPTQSKKTGNTYFAVLTPTATGRKDTGFGVKVPAMDTSLPKSVTLVDQDGTKHVLKLEAAPATYVDRDSKKTVERKNPGVRTQQKLVLSGDEKQVKVSISDLGEDTWNLKVTVSGISGGGGNGSPVRQVSDL